MNVLLLVFALSASVASPELEPRSSAPEEAPRWIVQVDPLTTAFGFVHLQVETALTPKLTVMASPHLRLFDGILPALDGDYLGLGLEGVVRYFPWGGAPGGFWIGPRGVLAWLHDATRSRAGGYASLLAGYTFMLGHGLVLGLGLGVSYFHYVIGSADVRGLLPAAHTTLGLAF